MKNEILPINFKGINNDVYAGFWVRVAADLLDFIIILPIVGLLLYLQGISKSVYFYSIIPYQLFTLFFHVFLVKTYGGTPGKLIMGLKIIQKNGDEVNWHSSCYRFAVEFFIAIIGIYAMILTLNLIDDSTYASLGFMTRAKFIQSINPFPHKIANWTGMFWTFSGIIVLISNQRKRTTHDFIAGTVVVKSIYLDKIREEINSTKSVEGIIE